MGRKRTVNHALPPHMRVRKGRFYYDTQQQPRKEIPLGADYGAALVKWAELEGKGLPSNTQPTFGMAWTRYRQDVLPGKAPRTQADNLEEAEHLLAVFRNAPLSQIKPSHVHGYLERRGLVAKVRANREKALLSHIFNKAREWDYTSVANPCAGIKGFSEPGRDKYVEETEFRAVYAQACVPVRNAMDLAYLTGQRPADVLKTTLQDVKGGFLWVTQGKTGAKLRIALEGDLGALVARLAHQPGKIASPYLIRNEDEQPLTYSAMAQRFQKARAAAVQHARESGQTALAASLSGFQFRDLRARAASDVDDLKAAQRLLGHGSAAMTERYVRARLGDKVRGVK